MLVYGYIFEGKVPYKNVLSHSEVRDEKGERMSKTKANGIPYDEAVEKMGADVMRWMYVIQNPANNLNFGYNIADETRRRFILLLWNVYNYFVTYALLDGFKPLTDTDLSKNVLDRWIISKQHRLIKVVTDSLEKYDAYSASWAIEGFLNDLSTWHVRRSRNRFGPSAPEDKDKADGYTTLFSVLVTLSKLLAPFTPFISEEIFKNLTGKESVHLENWPVSKNNLIDKKLEEEMVLVRLICELGHAQRKVKGIKVRQPLSKYKIQNTNYKLQEELLQLIKDELNVKEVVVETGEGEINGEFDFKITPALKAEGEVRDLIRQIQEARKEAGCGLSDQIEVGLPSWPKNYEEKIKKDTLASRLFVAPNLEIKH